MNEKEETVNYFLELASTQRMQIMNLLSKKKSRINEISKEIESTIQEVSRNFERLERTGLIVKQHDRYYEISTLGRIVCMQIPSISFISKNEKYFMEHNFEDLPLKFIQRIGSLEPGTLVNGYTRVLEKWKNVYSDAEEYIYNLLIDTPYSIEFMDIIKKKLQNKIEIKSVFSENTIVPYERKKILKKYDFDQYLKSNLLERKMKKDLKISIAINEKQAIVCFPFLNGETDLSKGFFSENRDFHEWCLDYFRYCMHTGKRFREDILNID